jgi:hypothetical protein
MHEVVSSELIRQKLLSGVSDTAGPAYPFLSAAVTNFRTRLISHHIQLPIKRHRKETENKLVLFNINCLVS